MDQVKGFTFYHPRTGQAGPKVRCSGLHFQRTPVASVSGGYCGGLAGEWAAQLGLGAV